MTDWSKLTFFLHFLPFCVIIEAKPIYLVDLDYVWG